MSARRALALALAAAALGCSRPRAPIADCSPAKDARPICKFHNPEDLALLPRAHALVVSQMGSIDGSKPGSLVFFDLAAESVAPAYPAAGADPVAPRAGWGDPHCPGPPGAAFDPHGIDLGIRPDGARELLVVNHGGRESVELFEVDDAPGAPALAWRGCALAPEGELLNDVAALPDGGFVATDSMPKAHASLYLLLGLLRLPTGCVLEWQAGSGFRKLPGSRGAFPNGIAVSPDGETLYVDLYFADEVRKVSRRTGELLGRARVQSPDNVNWSGEGILLVASHDAPLVEIAACGALERGQCPFHFAVIALEPERMEPMAVYENVGAPMGAGTTALRVGDELFVGTFAGDRILRIALPAWARQLLAGS